jgi:hypothetical protein
MADVTERPSCGVARLGGDEVRFFGVQSIAFTLIVCVNESSVAAVVALIVIEN